MSTLLTRDLFREKVFARDDNRCIVCGNPGQDAHHIIERRLFDDGGYYIDNGATLCGQHHLDAERTILSVECLREKLSITKPVLPSHFYNDERYDKWGNIVLSDGRRMKGDLFEDESVQKVLNEGGVLGLFIKYVKYPRTYHLPFSEGFVKDDRVLTSTDHFDGKEVVVTVKMDGENTTMYNDHIHARSLDACRDASRSWVKGFHSKIAFEIPEGWRICGENMYAAHSIHYNNLKSFFYGFSIWNGQNTCLSWDESVEWFSLLGIVPVPVLYRGIWNLDIMKNMYKPEFEGGKCEGFVVRLVDAFHYRNFKTSVAKYVRKDHITTDDHWRRTWKPNSLLE